MKSLSYYLAPTENKRLKIALSFGIANLVILVLLTLLKAGEVMAIGGALAAVNAPIYAYMFAETKRPSENIKPDEKENE